MAILRGLCPRCREGHIFRGPLFWISRMNPSCPVCGLRFEREPGYFLGAMYISYAMAVPVLVGFLVLFIWVLHVKWNHALLFAALCLVPFAPFLTLLARVIWIYFDRTVDPGR